MSTQIDLSDRSILRNPRLPSIILTPVTSGTLVVTTGAGVPRAVSSTWAQAIQQITARNWAAAETPLRAVVEAAPKFAAGWAALGTVYANVGKPEDAVKALDRAIELDPQTIPAVPLTDPRANRPEGLEEGRGGGSIASRAGRAARVCGGSFSERAGALSTSRL
ncbi:MAG: tetratricopeptide repeat protein [Ignavibacteriota bacterium]